MKTNWQQGALVIPEASFAFNEGAGALTGTVQSPNFSSGKYIP